jgi:serine/threonine-protein kinase
MGVLWFRALAGVLPVEPDPNPTTMLVEILGQPRPKLRDVEPAVPEELAAAVDRALMRAPDERHPSMAAFLEATLEGARADGLDVLDPRASLPPGVI